MSALTSFIGGLGKLDEQGEKPSSYWKTWV